MSDDSGVIEEVAKAMYRHDGRGMHWPAWDRATSVERNRYLRRGRVAVVVIRKTFVRRDAANYAIDLATGRVPRDR